MSTEKTGIRRHPPQLLRQMEQEDNASPLTSGEAQTARCEQTEGKHIETAPINRAPPVAAVTTCYPRSPVTQDSQGSSSTGSGATGMSLGTSRGSMSSSGKSTQLGPATRGTRCSSSTSSSTEETEARERRFGSLDLHPLPTVVTPAAVRCGLVGSASPGVHNLHLNALLTMHRRFNCQSNSPTDSLECHTGQPSVSTPKDPAGFSDSPNQPTALPAVSLDGKSEQNLSRNSSNQEPISSQNPLNLFGILPPALWPCLLCPLHGASLVKSSGLLMTDRDHDAVNTAQTDDAHSQIARPVSVNPDPTRPSESLGSSGAESGATAVETARGSPLTTVDPSTDRRFADGWLDSGTATPHAAPHIGPYQLGPTLGRGNFAVVKLAKHVPTKMKVAIKIMNKELIGPNNLSKISRELEAMKRCQHPHIVRLYHVMETESSIFMVTEYASKGEVFDHISISRAFSEKEARELFWQVVCAIDFCHHSGVVHRDLKAENLLLDSDFKIKVADFGFCNFFQPDEFLSTHCGSPQYAAPELFKGEPYDGPLVDVWSLGVILYIFVCGSFPFPGESLGDIRSQVLRGLVRFPFFLSTACEQVIRCMLQVDPARRFKLRQVVATQWMQESPNVEHYRAMMSRYEAKAKERQFDQLFRTQYPEHSELARVHQAERARNQLDCGVLRALVVGVGFDEEQVRLSCLQNKCDRWHAAYELLCAKIRRFQHDPHLCQYVDEALRASSGASAFSRSTRRRSSLLGAWRSPAAQSSSVGGSSGALGLTGSGSITDQLIVSSDGDATACVRRGTQLATVPDVIDEAMADVEGDQEHGGTETDQVSGSSERNSVDGGMATQKSSSPSNNADADRKRIGRWKDPNQPTNTDFNVALFILKADEDFIMAQLGLTPPASISPVGIPAVRRHTVQFTGSPLIPLRPAPVPPAPPPPAEPLVPTSRAKMEHIATATTAAEEPLSTAPLPNDETVHVGGMRVDKSVNESVSSPRASAQRTIAHRFPRQTTQPHIGAFQQFKTKAFQPEQLIRTALDWLPSPWGSGSRSKNSAATVSVTGGLQSDNHSATNFTARSTTTTVKTEAVSLTSQTLPSLELGEEASTSEPPSLPTDTSWRRIRPELQRRNSVQEYEDDLDTPSTGGTTQGTVLASTDGNDDDFQSVQPIDKHLLDQNTLDNTPAFMRNAGHLGYDVASTSERLLNVPPWGPTALDNVEFNRCLSMRSEPHNDDSGVTVTHVAMETDGPDGTTQYPEPSVFPIWSHSPAATGETQSPDSDVCDPAAHLSTLLPQLNLPANLPAMIHQPVARFTVKDPHLLAPPDFMTPHCSSFPRRSSDGAAELQPLHRPALAVGGSYPEQTNYRNIHSSTEDTTDARSSGPSAVGYIQDAASSFVRTDADSTGACLVQANKSCDAGATVALGSDTDGASTGLTVTTGTVSPCGPTAKQNAPSSRPRGALRVMYPAGSRLRTAPLLMTNPNRTTNLLAAQQRSILSSVQLHPTDRTLWRSFGRRQQAEQLVGGDETSKDQPSPAVLAQLARHRKRFSLPASYRPVRQVTLPDRADPEHNGTCLCNYPLTPELVQYIQHLIQGQPGQVTSPLNLPHPLTVNRDATVCSPLEAVLFRRGSEASQLLAWKYRLNQYGGMFEPNAPETTFGPPTFSSNLAGDGGHGCANIGPTPSSVSKHSNHPVYLSSMGSNQSGETDLPVQSSDPLRLSPTMHEARTHMDTQTLSDLVELLPAQSGLSPTSPPGIELNDLKTELHKLETESQSNSQACHSTVTDEDISNRLNSPSSPSPLVSGSQAGEVRPHHMHTDGRYPRSNESPTSALPPAALVANSNAETITACSSLAPIPRPSLSAGPEVPVHWTPHRVSSLKVPRRATSAVAGYVGRGHSLRQSPNGDSVPGQSEKGTLDADLESNLPRRHRYSVGDNLDNVLSALADEFNFASVLATHTPPFTPLSCQPSVSGLHSQPNGQHRAIAPTLSNPDQSLSFGYRLGRPRLSSASRPFIRPTVALGSLATADDPDRTALSSPGPTPMLDVPLTGSNHTSQSPFSGAAESEGLAVATAAGPSSAGIKRRLLGPVHQKSNDYLRTLQRAGGSLDRRLNFDLFNSPKRKVYQEWLPKVAAFSRKAATTMLQAMQPNANCDQPPPGGLTLSPSATSSVCGHLMSQSHSVGTSTSPLEPTGGPSGMHFAHMSTSTKSSTSSLTHDMDQESNNVSAECVNVAADTGQTQLEHDNDEDDCVVLSEDEPDEDEEDDAAEEEEEKQCALAPLQSHLAMSMAYAHSTRTRYNLTSMTAAPCLASSSFSPSYLIDPHQTSAGQQQLATLTRSPNLVQASTVPSAFQTGNQFVTGYSGQAISQGGTSAASINTPVYAIPNDPHTVAAAAAAAASLMLLRPADDDEDLAEIDRVNQRLAMGELADLIPSAYVTPDNSCLRNFFGTSQNPGGPSQTHSNSPTFPNS